MIAQNAFEFLGYLVLEHNLPLAKSMVDGYMLASYVITSAGLYFCLTLTNNIETQRYNLPLAMLPFTMIILHFSGMMVSDYAFNGYTLIRVAAPMYFIFEAWSIFCAIASVIVLIQKIRTTTDYITAAKCTIGIFAIAPFCVVVVTVMSLMHFNINISTAIVMPISGVFFLLILMKTTEKEILNIAYGFVLIKAFMQSSPSLLFKRGVPLQERMALFEEIWIKIAQEEANGSQRIAAQILGMHESTLSRKISKIQEKSLQKITIADDITTTEKT
jgi:hypothetical protein